MQLKHLTLSTVCAVAAILSAAPAATAEDTIYVPLLTYRTGPYAGSGTPIANGMHDYLSLLNERQPASLAICALLDKQLLSQPMPQLRWVGFVAPPAFLVGYGLDHAEDFRHLPFIGDLI